MLPVSHERHQDMIEIWKFSDGDNFILCHGTQVGLNVDRIGVVSIIQPRDVDLIQRIGTNVIDGVACAQELEWD